jgi:hypothetical protein
MIRRYASQAYIRGVGESANWFRVHTSSFIAEDLKK